MTRPICASLAEDVTKQTRAAAQWLCDSAICFPYSHPESTLRGKLCFPLRRRIMQQKHMSGIKKKKKKALPLVKNVLWSYEKWNEAMKNTTGFLMVHIPHRIMPHIIQCLGESLHYVETASLDSLNPQTLNVCAWSGGVFPVTGSGQQLAGQQTFCKFWNPAKGSST